MERAEQEKVTAQNALIDGSIGKHAGSVDRLCSYDELRKSRALSGTPPQPCTACTEKQGEIERLRVGIDRIQELAAERDYGELAVALGNIEHVIWSMDQEKPNAG